MGEGSKEPKKGERNKETPRPGELSLTPAHIVNTPFPAHDMRSVVQFIDPSQSTRERSLLRLREFKSLHQFPDSNAILWCESRGLVLEVIHH